MKIPGFLLLALCVVPAHAAIYKWVDAAGNVHFSDQPREGARPVELSEPTVYPGVKSQRPDDRPPPAGQEAEEPPAAPLYERLRITSPANDVNIWAGDGNVEVDVDLAPRLQEGHRLVISLDGRPLDREFAGGRLVMTNVDRGTHRLTAEIRDGDGTPLLQSDPVVFHLKRASELNRKPK